MLHFFFNLDKTVYFDALNLDPKVTMSNGNTLGGGGSKFHFSAAASVKYQSMIFGWYVAQSTIHSCFRNEIYPPLHQEKRHMIVIKDWDDNDAIHINCSFQI